jgi:ATP-dependent Lon protease
MAVEILVMPINFTVMDSIELPETLPVMTLPNTVLFPQSLLPLHIFEPRYRAMLRDVLHAHRLFAVARMDEARLTEPGAVEPPHRIAAVGIVRACQGAEDGTSNLLLQGVCRVEISAIVRELPYRIIAIRPLASVSGGQPAELEILRLEVMRLLQVRRRLGAPAPKGMTQFLDSIQDFDTFADIAAFNLCEDAQLKQRLLEELDTHRRLQLFAGRLRAEIETHRLRRKLQGGLDEGAIANN